MNVLVVGGRGHIGRAVVDELRKNAHTVRVSSRRAFQQAGVETVLADLLTQQGLDAAVAGVDVLINCVGSPDKDSYQTEVLGLAALLSAAKRANVNHVIHISIVGIDRIPSAYYKLKLKAEQVVETSGIPYTVVRMTQFHGIIDKTIMGSAKIPLPVMLLPMDLHFQLLDSRDAAAFLMPYIAEGDKNELVSVGGPEIATSKVLLNAWLKARQSSRLPIHIPMLGKQAAGMRKAYNTIPDSRTGSITWEDYLHERFNPDGTEAMPLGYAL